MRVLLTGMTRPQNGLTSRSQTNLCSNPALLVRAMQAAGHSVKWGPVTAGDDLDEFDCAIVGLSNMFSFGAQWRIGAIWAIGHEKTAILVDDWNMWGVISTLQGVSRGGPGALFREVLPTDGVAEGWKYIREILGTVDELVAGKWTRPTIGSFFSWGDLEIFKRVFPFVGDLWAFDPSIFQPIVQGAPLYEEKIDEWVLASLPNHTKWVGTLGLGWPVRYFGRRTGGAYVQEREVVSSYRNAWGVLSPPYKHAGCGWWRNRFKYAADAGCVLLAEEDEVRGLGPAYTLSQFNVCDIENMTDFALKDLAKAQKETLYDRMWTEEAFVEWADGMVRRLARGE